MANPDTDSELIQAATNLVLARYEQGRKLKEETRNYSLRTGKIAKAYRKRILDKTLAMAGVDQEEIRKRQAENDESDQRFLASVQPIVAENVRQTNERTKQLVKGIKAKYHKFPSPRPFDPCPPLNPPPLPYVAFLSTAGQINYTNPIDPPLPNFNASSASEENVFQFTTGQTNSQYYITVPFPWCPPVSGYLSLLSVVAFNGSNWWGAKHGCVEAVFEQEGDVGVWLVDTTAGTPPDPCALQSFLYKYRDWMPGCSSDIGMGLVDQPLILTADPARTWVTAGHKLVIMVVFVVQFWGDEAIGEIDFATNGKSINVTGVFLNISANADGTS